MLILGLNNCDSCRRARRELKAAGREYQFRDIREAPPSGREIADIIAAVGVDRAVNRKSATWRQLDEPTRDRDAVELLIAHPTLLKRPAIIAETGVSVGWDAQVAAQHGIT